MWSTKLGLLNIVCYKWTKHFFTLKMAAPVAGNPHIYQAPKHLISYYYYLMTGGIVQTLDTKLHVNCWHQLRLDTLHAHQPEVCSKNCHRDWGNVHNSQCCECSCHTGNNSWQFQGAPCYLMPTEAQVPSNLVTTIQGIVTFSYCY
jgi:hypothetical protein